ncbi:ROK family transcriptional regulator [Kitasatospora sp. NRRL B-11411]|uniref:ROK family transcriptional regulator n=1 Tax=Kitasatospora sp. NRRL B-11411 TaxID=1463822 RepID=UPI0018E36FE0|nr:ROK family transcriptional regulator [Kitasatospora sp. NRRL B-11411]
MPAERLVPRLWVPASGSAADPAGQRTKADVFAAILTAGPMSRTEVAQQLRLSQSTVTKIVNPLMDAGYLVEDSAAAAEGAVGRPRRMLQVRTELHLVVGVKIGPSKVTAVLTDLGAQVLARWEQPLADRRIGAVVAATAQGVRELLASVPGSAERMLGLGVGVSGHVDPVAGLCRYSALMGWHDEDVAGPLAAATGLPVAVGNDVNTLVVAEQWFGHGRDTESFAVVTVGPGVGCGLLLGGRLHLGRTGLAGEFGHMPLDPAGPVCSCGNTGCLEALVSYGAVLRRLREAGLEGCDDIDEAVALARSGRGPDSKTALAAFAAAGDALGRGLAGLCNLLNLEKIVLAGEGAAVQDLFGPAMAAALREHAFSTAAADCEVIVDAVTDDLWARGAACLVIRDAVQS